jgi:hypothetical protein
MAGGKDIINKFGPQPAFVLKVKFLLLPNLSRVQEYTGNYGKFTRLFSEACPQKAVVT